MRVLIVCSSSTTVAPERGKRGRRTSAAIDAAVKADVKHIVFMSAVARGRRRNRRAARSYWRGEHASCRHGAGLDHFGRMNFLCRSFPATGAGVAEPGRDGRARREPGCFRARDDVAAAAAGILIATAMQAQSTTLPVPSACRCGTRGPHRRNHRPPLAFRVITEEQLRAALTQAGLPAGAVDIVTGIQASFAAGTFDIVTGDVERLGGRRQSAPRRTCCGAEVSLGRRLTGERIYAPDSIEPYHFAISMRCSVRSTPCIDAQRSMKSSRRRCVLRT